MIVKLSILLLALTPADAPVVGRPREHFYGAVGEPVRIEMKASPTQLRAEDPFDLTLVITGAANPEQIERPDLKQLPDFAQRFHIDDLPEDAPPKGQHIFRYRLRPKSERVRDVPPLLFHYWNPRLNYFATTASHDPIALNVRPRNAPSAISGPLEEPESLFEMPSERSLKWPALSDDWQMALLMLALLVPPLVFEGWYLVWRWSNPSAAHLARMRRSKALRDALDRLDEVRDLVMPDLADEVDAVVRGYLHARFGVARSGSTPHEIVLELTHRGAPPTITADVEEFFRACDAARFGPPSADHASLVGRAKAVVLNAEAPG